MQADDLDQLAVLLGRIRAARLPYINGNGTGMPEPMLDLLALLYADGPLIRPEVVAAMPYAIITSSRSCRPRARRAGSTARTAAAD